MKDSDCQNREYQKDNNLHFGQTETVGKFCANGTQRHGINVKANEELKKTFEKFGENKCVLLKLDTLNIPNWNYGK